VPILKKSGVKSSEIFGSYARGDNKKNSDLDLIVDFKFTVGLFDLVDLKNKLEKKIKIKVDILTQGGINPLVAPYIHKDKVKIL